MTLGVLAPYRGLGIGEFISLSLIINISISNVGGAWTPIGDITTTMLWIHGPNIQSA
ncbi:hypothetical protein PHJA_001368500 [Phtheirospermum japonicum]|uniref:Uncharacterized protein n=1 Tax=Phtheirospermum japonicum TaxID=374723 RepID=A0A830C7A1_9LAMI|nr:hypothetical protein PHJA_001368500 [Phtheirospermum japonicum]